jgi:hypothetical protein
MNRLACPALLILMTSPFIAQASQDVVDPLTPKPGTAEEAAVRAILDAWNTSHTRARAAIKMQTDRYRSRKEQPPPVVHYAAAILMMQIGAHAAPDVDGHLAKAGDHPVVSLAKARIAVREDDLERAAKSAADAAGDKRSGELGEAMQETIAAIQDPNPVRKARKSAKSPSSEASQVLQMVDDAKAKLNADLANVRAEMRLLDSRYRASGEELVRLRNDLVWIQNQTAGVLPNGFRGYYYSVYDRALAITQCQQRIAAVEEERRQAQVRHAQLQKFEANEVAKATWRMWSARLPWNVEDERKRLLAGKTPAEYYGSTWVYKPSLPNEFPRQIPKPYLSKKK